MVIIHQCNRLIPLIQAVKITPHQRKHGVQPKLIQECVIAKVSCADFYGRFLLQPSAYPDKNQSQE